MVTVNEIKVSLLLLTTEISLFQEVLQYTVYFLWKKFCCILHFALGHAMIFIWFLSNM